MANRNKSLDNGGMNPSTERSTHDRYDLARFVSAQDEGGTHDQALAELRRGRKTSHWMWFVFPQLAGLGRSPIAQRYAVSSLAEAQAYLAHPLLGPRLREAARLALAASGAGGAGGPGGPSGVSEGRARSAEDVFGGIDGIKLRSSMTLFLRADPAEDLFQRVLDVYFDGKADENTDRLLKSSR
jgi:uncharacterized protein (DUF1810 family)